MARQVGLSKETHVERSTLTTLDGSVVQTGSVDMAVEDGALLGVTVKSGGQSAGGSGAWGGNPGPLRSERAPGHQWLTSD